MIKMKNYNFLKLNLKMFFSLGALFFILMSFFSCSSDDDLNGNDCYLNIEGDPTNLNVGVEGVEQKYVVRSNCSWEVVPQGEGDWVEVSPQEREGNGVFRFIVSENTGFEKRSMDFKFIMNGEEKDLLFSVEQESNIAFLEIEGGIQEINTSSIEDVVTIVVDSNVDWSYLIDEVDWIEEQEGPDDEIRLLIRENLNSKRSATITISSNQYPELTKEVVVNQSSEKALLEENFDWLSYGSTIPYEWQDTQRYDSWTKDERDRGWTSTPVAASKDQPLLYGQNGFVKLGKTGYGGDIISPKLEGIEGTSTVKVTFKAATYISAGGTKDDNILRISVLGSGESDITKFEIDNYPNSQSEDEEGIENNIWDPSRAYSFLITGATAETQIKFLASDYELKGIGKGKNRIFLDDIQVKIVETEE